MVLDMNAVRSAEAGLREVLQRVDTQDYEKKQAANYFLEDYSARTTVNLCKLFDIYIKHGLGLAGSC